MREQTRSWIIYALLGVLVAATVAVGFLLFPASARDAKFFLSLGMLILAEAEVFLLPTFCGRTVSEGARPWRFAQYSVGYFYALAVAAIAALVAPDSDLHTLIAVYLMATFAFLLGIGLTSVRAGHTQDSQVAYRARKAWLADWTDRFEVQAVRIAALADAGAQAQLAAVRDDLAYADRESLPGAEAIEAELEAALAALVAPIAAGAGADVETQLRRLRETIRRRNDKIKALRAG